MDKNILVITLKQDVPADTVSRKGFHLLNMGRKGMYLVDEEHPGYPGCVRKAIKIATDAGNTDLADKYKKLPGWKKDPVQPAVDQITEPAEDKKGK